MDIERLRRILEHSRKKKSEIRKNVEDYFDFAGLDADDDVLNILQIVRSSFREKGFLVLELPLQDQEIGALSYKGDGQGYVVVNTSLPKVNINFALAHEIYHVFYQTSEFVSKVEFANDTYFEHEEEFAANLFAGMLLMPENGFTRLFHKFEKVYGSGRDSVDTLIRLMAYYEVPYMAVLIRCWDLGLLSTSPISEYLLNLTHEQIESKLAELWLDEDILKPTNKNDFHHIEALVKRKGREYIEEEYIKERTLERVLANMRSIYGEIKGDE